jgi:hypothetical protein
MKQLRRYVDDEDIPSLLAALTREAQWIDGEVKSQSAAIRKTISSLNLP